MNKKIFTSKNWVNAILLAVFVLSLSFFCCFITTSFIGYRYPLKYTEEIKLCSSKYSLDCSLVAGVINAESDFDAMAVSKKDARGLMQLLPSTAKWIAKELNVQNYTTEKLFEPSLNIEFGCFYLNYLSKKFYDTQTILAAYNAGETTVRGWLLSTNYSKDGKSLATIPYIQTNNYVDKVMRSVSVYSKRF